MGREETIDYGIGQLLTSNDAFACTAESWASVSSNSDLRPLLSYSNEWGRYTQYRQGEFGFMGSVAFAHRMVDHRFGFKACFSDGVCNGNKTKDFSQCITLLQGCKHQGVSLFWQLLTGFCEGLGEDRA